MKLIIQIPCYNEADSLPRTLADLPREVEGFDRVEWMVVDDGSTDDTGNVAEQLGVDHVVRLKTNNGLASAFMVGVSACLAEGADVIINTDADNQYDARDIPLLVAPIFDGKADIVIGARPVAEIEHFSVTKRFLQRLGSFVVRRVSGTSVPDAPSGFRAFSREAAKKINVFSQYTYTIETIIQAGMKNISVVSVPVRVNAELRPSRLVRSVPEYVLRSVLTIIRIFAVYRPFRFFASVGLVLFGIGLLLGLRFLYFVAIGEGSGHIQSVVLAGLLLSMGAQAVMVAFLADLIGVNRQLLERVKFDVGELGKWERQRADDSDRC